MKLGTAIAEIMKREGIEILCGYPVNHLIEHAANADIRPVMVRQERIGIHMADAISRVTSGRTIGAYVGLVPSEYSSGERIRRGHITHAGNLHLRTQLVESAWAYKSRAGIGAQIARRHHNVAPEVIARAWKAQLRLCGRYRKLMARGKRQGVVVTAIAREMAAFLWAIGREVQPQRAC